MDERHPQAAGRPSPAAGSRLHATGWSSPQGGFDRLEIEVDRNPPQAGQGQCHSTAWAGEAPEGGQPGMGRQTCWRGSGPGWGREVGWTLAARVAKHLPAGLWDQDCSQRGMGRGSLPAPGTSPTTFAVQSPAQGSPSAMDVGCLEQIWPRPQCPKGPEGLVGGLEMGWFVAGDGTWALGAVSSCCVSEEKDEGAGLSLEAHTNRARGHSLGKGTLQQGREGTFAPQDRA